VEVGYCKGIGVKVVWKVAMLYNCEVEMLVRRVAETLSERLQSRRARF